MTKKWNYLDNLEYQQKAIQSTIRLFDNFEFKTSYILTSGIFNNIKCNPCICKEEWENLVFPKLQEIQKDNDIVNKEKILYTYNDKFPVFDIEMETGTGKTYIFLRTIHELYKKKFSKFIILVPSIAIQEGVCKAIQTTFEHFDKLYNNRRISLSKFNGQQSDIDKFLFDSGISVLIMNINKINKSGNIINQELENLNNKRIIDLINSVNPVVIIDEPQTTSSGDKSVNAIKNLNPNFILRYSATFKRKDKLSGNLIYKLGPIDAYNQNLVKKIICSPVVDPNQKNNQYIKLEDLDIKNQTCKLKLSIDGKFRTFNCKANDDLFLKTNNKNYKGYIIDENGISFKENNKYVLFTNGEKINIHSTNLDDSKLKESQIYNLIKTHLDNQINLLNKNIKVLSLFFLEEVQDYRIYDENLNHKLGKYGEIFEKELIKILVEDQKQENKYSKILNGKTIDEFVSNCHKGYFSKDSKSKENETFNLIMKEKEKLLSFSSDVCFIFSHSALQEGWDSPNVFQICFLRNKGASEIRLRQQIGRGLRLCVNDKLERIIDVSINKLTIFINDTYDEFVSQYQKELKEDGILLNQITTKLLVDKLKLNCDQADFLIEELKKNKILDSNNLVVITVDEFENKINNLILNNVELDFLNDKKIELNNLLFKKSEIEKYIKNSTKTKYIKLNREVFNDSCFSKIWKIIESKTKYNVHFETNDLIYNVIKLFSDKSNEIQCPKLFSYSYEIKMNYKTGLDGQNIGITPNSYRQKIDSWDINELINEVLDKTNLTRHTIIKILSDSLIKEKIKINLVQTKKILLECIDDSLKKLMVNGIKYTKIDEVWKQEIFDDEIIIYEDNDHDNVYEVKNKHKSLYEKIKLDSKIEKEFARDCDMHDEVKLFIKLPKKFIIKTPIGNYNPDWALNINEELIFVVETKGSIDENNLNNYEKYKIECGKSHFSIFNTSNFKYDTAKNLEDILTKC